MKRSIKIFVISVLFFVAPVVLLAQTPPHPNGGNAPGSGNTPVGGGAPIGSGLVMLMAMGVAYSAKKVYNLRKEE
jgi:hypothetical protein